MADSRSARSEFRLLRSGEASFPPNNFQFECFVCGGRDSAVEVRRGVVAAALQEYEQADFGDEPNTHKVHRCIRCAAAHTEARLAVRDVLIGRLLFDARNLAMCQFTRFRQYGEVSLICAECRTPQIADNFLRHKEHCRVGRVLRLLHALISLDDVQVFHEVLNGAAGLTPFLAVSACADRNGGAR